MLKKYPLDQEIFFFCFVGKKNKKIQFYIEMEQNLRFKCFLLCTRLIIKNLNKKKLQNLQNRQNM